MKDYDEFDDYGGGGFEKFTHRAKKKKFKGHQSRHGKRSYYDIGEDGGDEGYYTPRQTVTAHYTKNAVSSPVVNNPTPAYNNNNSKPGNYVPKEHVYGPNTHTIKGVKIDFDGVAKIEQFERPKDGKTTYGIKFIFKGRSPQQAYRIIWFNWNQLERDRIYASEMSYWLKLQKGTDTKEN